MSMKISNRVVGLGREVCVLMSAFYLFLISSNMQASSLIVGLRGHQSQQPCTAHFTGSATHSKSCTSCPCSHTSAFMARHLTIFPSVSGRSRLRSADDNQLLVQRTQIQKFGPKAFYSSGPATWNSLTPEL